MTTLMSYLAGFGLAASSGAKAFIPVLLLGLAHYTDYFELSEKYLWIADPVVMTILAVLVLVEIVVDAHPELGELSDHVAYLPKAVGGFIAFAAATGEVHDSLLELSASGLLGAATASGVHWVRNTLRRPFRQSVEGVHESAGKLASLGEAGVATGVAGAAVVVPPLSLLLLGAVGAGAAVVLRMAGARRVRCRHCGGMIRPGALVCIHCGREQRPGENARDAAAESADGV